LALGLLPVHREITTETLRGVAFEVTAGVGVSQKWCSYQGEIERCEQINDALVLLNFHEESSEIVDGSTCLLPLGH
jgi:hypothetical protein